LRAVRSLDQARNYGGLTGIGNSEDNGTPYVAIAQQIRQDGRNHHSEDNGPPSRRTRDY
jgi:hypothetical protein